MDIKIAVLSSGGDAPGMNAAIRSVVRTAAYYNIEVYGVYYGYNGLIDNDLIKMRVDLVANIIQRGGTILKTARSDAFRKRAGRAQAYENLRKRAINVLVVIGGDGTFAGAQEFCKEYPDIRCVGIPATIDNDIIGTEYTIGFDTALNTAINAMDKIRDTADSHDRLFIVEVMGRNSGYIALYSAMATGATEVFIPEQKTDIDLFCRTFSDRRNRRKNVYIIVVGEGVYIGAEAGARGVEKILREKITGVTIKTAILGHIQRGGNPSALDRITASRMGYCAVKTILAGDTNKCTALVNQEIVARPFAQKQEEPLLSDKNALQKLEILRILAK